MSLLINLFAIFLSFEAFAGSELIYDAQKKNLELTEKDKSTLEIGEISTARYVTGGILGTYPIGFGVGHAIQNRWSDKGYIFTWGELGSLGAVVVGAVGCMNRVAEDAADDDDDDEWSCSGLDTALIVGGAIGFIGFRIWEIVDVWAAPPSHNKKYKELKKYIETTEAKPVIKSSLDLVPIVNPRFGQGLGLKFVF